MPDNLTIEQRRHTMSRIRSKDTQPELTVRRLAHARGMRFQKHKDGLPGRPDLVFTRAKVVVFVDGDFWHGWQFPRWRAKLAPYWRNKIEGNRRRDRRNFQSLRRRGWQVLRIWEHDVRRDPASCIDRIESALRGHSDNSVNGQR